MKKMGKRLFFLTNASNINRKMFMEKLNKRGVEAKIDDVYCASYLSALYFKMCLPNINSVYISYDNYRIYINFLGLFNRN